MSEEPLLSWLVEQPSFNQEYNALLIASVHSQFPMFSTLSNDCNWGYLLKCGSFLAYSKNAAMQDMALRISQFCLQSGDATSTEHKNSAQFILNKLANRRAITLAKEKGLLTQDSDNWKSTFLGNLNWIKEEISHSVWLQNGERMDVNSFQKAFWEALNTHDILSISAPTSAGKSHLIKQWILERLSEGKRTQIIYVVPTRALIAEVHADFQKALSEEIKQSKVIVTTFPFIKFSDDDNKPKIFVLTQERLQLLLQRNPGKIDILIVDEAYKFGDGTRGVLLQHVVEKVNLSNPKAKIVYISPLASNPEVLLEGNGAGYSQKFGDITVNQNLIFAKQTRGRKWSLELCHANGKDLIGDIELPSTPSPDSQRLPMLAYALSPSGGNIIYVNGAADAEKMAHQLCDLIGFDNYSEDKGLQDLIELCERVIHKEYRLISALKYGVAFHYGNMPLLIKEEIESLFREGVIKYLVCTSTLVEGVNLPCRNIFIRAPKRGAGNVMNAADFWNLAGRAGRWGKDFQGNIICVDPHIWNPPEEKTLTVIQKATEQALERQDDLLEYIEKGTPRELAATKENKILEAMASYLAISSNSYGSIKNIPWMKGKDLNQIRALEKAVNERLSTPEIPQGIIASHPGISPLAMRAMLGYFETINPPFYETLLLPYASDSYAVDRFIQAFKSMYGHLTNEFSNSEKHIFQQALITVKWMQGHSIRRIIEERQKKVPGESIHDAIRKILDMIENVARFTAPKYTSCYNDLLKHFFGQKNRPDLVAEISDLTLFLEMGVNTKTHLALMNLGLSRTSAVEIKAFITADSLSERECLEWFSNPNNKWASQDLPAIVKREIEKMLEIHIS